MHGQQNVKEIDEPIYHHPIFSYIIHLIDYFDKCKFSKHKLMRSLMMM